MTRVSTLPRIGTTSRSGRIIFSSAIRRAAPVPTLAPAGRSASFRPSRATSASFTAARSVTAARCSPSGAAVGRSFSECTAKSISPAYSASRRALTNTPVPPITDSASREVSPYVVTWTSSTARPVAAVTAAATIPDWARARALALVPSRNARSEPGAGDPSSDGFPLMLTPHSSCPRRSPR